MFPEADAFLDAIWAAPGDDTPRLVYADWLEEHGQAAYARFIRAQCEAARHPLWSPAANAAWEEVGRAWPGVSEAFWLTAERDWSIPFSFTAGNPDATDFHRGFLCPEVGVRLDYLTRYWSLWWPFFPTPECVLDPVAKWDAIAAGCPTLTRVRRLRLGGGDEWGDEENWEWPRYRGNVLHFLDSPYLRNVELLDVSSVFLLTEHHVEELLTPELFPRVRELRVRVVNEEWFSHRTQGPVPCTAAKPGSPQARLEAKFGRVIVVSGDQ